jgi:hypothetical protein
VHSEPPRLESGLEYSKARAVRESYLARLAKIEFEERTAKLVSADDVKVSAFNRFRQFRDGMLNIPDRLASVLAAEADPRTVYDLLATEIRKALTEFSDASRSRHLFASGSRGRAAGSSSDRLTMGGPLPNALPAGICRAGPVADRAHTIPPRNHGLPLPLFARGDGGAD